MLIRIGVTGGIGSGKTRVCEEFAALGSVTLSADAIAHEITDSNPAVREKIRARFGNDAYATPSGVLNRSYIARIVFEEREKLNALDSIVHPFVFKAIDAAIRRHTSNSTQRYIIVEAALLFESKLNERMDYVLTVVADEGRRLQRISTRDKLPAEEIRLRMSNQMPVDDAIARSDFALYNNDTLHALRASVRFFHTVFNTLAPHLTNSHEPHR